MVFSGCGQILLFVSHWSLPADVVTEFGHYSQMTSLLSQRAFTACGRDGVLVVCFVARCFVLFFAFAVWFRRFCFTLLLFALFHVLLFNFFLVHSIPLLEATTEMSGPEDTARNTVKMTDGGVYAGEWKAGKREGTGKANGDVYEGEQAGSRTALASSRRRMEMCTKASTVMGRGRGYSKLRLPVVVSMRWSTKRASRSRVVLL